MPDSLSMQTERVRAFASTLFSRSSAIQEDVHQLLFSSRGMEWYGSNRDIFQAEIESLLQAILSAAETGQTLAMRVYQTVDQWQGIDAGYAQEFAALVLMNSQKENNS